MSSDDPLGRLPQAARQDLDELARALERVALQDLPLFTDRTFDEEHVRAVEEGKRVAADAGLTEPIRAAQQELADMVIRMYGSQQVRAAVLGSAYALPAGTDEDRIQMLQSLADAVTATVLGDRLEPDVHAELLGLWARLLP